VLDGKVLEKRLTLLGAILRREGGIGYPASSPYSYGYF
jgi:hypothetical protein